MHVIPANQVYLADRARSVRRCRDDVFLAANGLKGERWDQRLSGS